MPAPDPPKGARLRRCRLPWLPALAMLAGFAAAPGYSADPVDAREELNEITTRLNALDAWMSDAERRQRKWQRELKRSDQNVSSTAARIRTIKGNLRSLREELDSLAAEQSRLSELREDQARRIADHLGAAYRLSSEDFFKALLNQQHPTEFERMIRYHGYISAARLETLTDYEHTLAALGTNLEQVRAREQVLADRQRELDAQLDNFDKRKKERWALLSRLDNEMADRAEQRVRLTEDRTRLESLVAELASRAQQLDGKNFSANRGALPWPLRGKVSQRFGSKRAGGRLTWHGVFIDAPDGAEVKAVHRGRVAFADWLRGFGLLTIVDHGSGFMTLYAHTDVLYKNVGDWVEGGEPIAAAGTSGGHPQPGLYFELRANGKPRDPLGWLVRR